MKSPDELTEAFRAPGPQGHPATPVRSSARSTTTPSTRRPSRSTKRSGSRCPPSRCGPSTRPSTTWPTWASCASSTSAPGRPASIPTSKPHHHLVCDRCGKVRRRVRRRLGRRRASGATPAASPSPRPRSCSAAPAPSAPPPHPPRPAHRPRRAGRAPRSPPLLVPTTPPTSKRRPSMPEFKGSQTQAEPEGGVRRREPGQPSLPLLRPEGRRRGLPRCRRPVPLGGRGRDGPRLRSLRLPGRGRRPRHRRSPSVPTSDNLKSAITGETYEYTEMYPGFSKTARDEGFDEIAEWLETLARAEKSHAGRFTAGPRGAGRVVEISSGRRAHRSGHRIHLVRSRRDQGSVPPRPPLRASSSFAAPRPRGAPMADHAKLTLDDISDLRAYERERAEFRAHVIALKKRRRVHVGPVVTPGLREPRHDPLPDPGDGPGREAHQRRGHRDRARHLQPAHPRAGRAVGHAVHRADQRGRAAPVAAQAGRASRARSSCGWATTTPSRCAAVVDADHEKQLTRDEITASVHYVHWQLTPDQVDRLRGRAGAARHHPPRVRPPGRSRTRHVP